MDADVSFSATLKASEAAAITSSDVVRRLQANESRGLSDAQVEERRKIHGLNEFTIKEEDPLWKKYLKQVCLYGVHYLEIYLPAFIQFNDPLILLLLASAFISVCTKQFDDAFSITVVTSI